MRDSVGIAGFSRKCRLIYSSRNQVTGCLGMVLERGRSEVTRKFWGMVNGYVHNLDCGNNFIGTCICQTLSNYVL